MARTNYNKQWLDYAEKKLQIAQTNYTIAMNYYKQLAFTFLKSIQDSTQVQSNELKQDLFASIISKTLTEDIDYSTLINQFEQELVDSVFYSTASNQNILQDLLDAIKRSLYTKEKQLERTSVKAYWTELSAEFDKIFEKYNVKQSIEEQSLLALNTVSASLNIGKAKGSVNGAYAFYKRVLLNTLNLNNNALIKNELIRNNLLNQDSKTGYAHLIAGYFREQVLLQSLQNFLTKNQSNLKVKPSPANYTYYDIVVHTNKDLTSALLEETGVNNLHKLLSGSAILTQPDIQSTIPYFGIQSKSWVAPTTLTSAHKDVSKQFYKIGNRKDILVQMPKYYSTEPTWDRGWHNYTAQCSKIIYQLLGQYQVAYSLPGHFIWTYDLINQMHSNNLFLNFYFKRSKQSDDIGQDHGIFQYPATEEVVWQKRLTLYAFKAKAKRKKST